LSLDRFRDIHKDETCLVLGNGQSLSALPLSFLEKYPSIGGNTICEHELKLWYYAAVDTRVRREFGNKVLDKFSSIPKFIPTPNLDKWQGRNFYRWKHRAGEIKMSADDFCTRGITYNCIMDVQLQIANLMGFSTILIVGMDRGFHRAHFWGSDEGIANRDSAEWWATCDEYHTKLIEGYRGKIINISTVSGCEVFERGDWKEWM